MASGSPLATWPETNVNTPDTTEKFMVPAWLLGSNTISSITMRPLPAIEKVVSSASTTPKAAPSAVSMTSPWKI